MKIETLKRGPNDVIATFVTTGRNEWYEPNGKDSNYFAKPNSLAVIIDYTHIGGCEEWAEYPLDSPEFTKRRQHYIDGGFAAESEAA